MAESITTIKGICKGCMKFPGRKRMLDKEYKTGCPVKPAQDGKYKFSDFNVEECVDYERDSELVLDKPEVEPAEPFPQRCFIHPDSVCYEECALYSRGSNFEGCYIADVASAYIDKIALEMEKMNIEITLLEAAAGGESKPTVEESTEVPE